MTRDQRFYMGFIKAAIENGVSLPQAFNLFKRAGIGSMLQGIGGDIKGGLQATKGMGSDIMGGMKAFGNSPAGLASGVGAGAAGLGGLAGLGMGENAALDRVQPAIDQMAAAPIGHPHAPGVDPNAIPEWLKMLGIGAGGAGLGAGAMAMAGNNKDEEHQQAGVPVPQIV